MNITARSEIGSVRTARAERETGEMLKVGLSDFGRKRRILLAIYVTNITFQLLTVFSCQKKITISNCFSALTFYNREKRGKHANLHLHYVKYYVVQNTVAFQFNKIFVSVNNLQHSAKTKHLEIHNTLTNMC